MRCACGYELVWHESGGHCPLCACGAIPGEHLPVAVTPSPLVTYDTSGNPITWDGRQLAVCPGKPLTAAGKLPTLRRGSFREPPPPPRYERRPGWGDILFAVVEPDEPDVELDAPPLVPARHTISLDEIAKQAMPVGKQAAALGWDVEPYYAVHADGTQRSILVLWRGDLRAVAYWERVAPAGWRTAGCRAWRLGEWPRAIGVKALVAAIVEIGALS
jgi:hypothetical protein